MVHSSSDSEISTDCLGKRAELVAISNSLTVH